MKTMEWAWCVAVMCLGFVVGVPQGLAVDADHDGFDDEWERIVGTDPSSAASRPDLADHARDLVACWPLTNGVQESLQGVPAGEVRNGARISSGALLLDGVDDYLSFGSSLSVTGSLSYAVWMKPPSRGFVTRLLGKFKTARDQREFCAFFALDGRLWVYVSDNGTTDYGHFIMKMSDAPVVCPGKWMHVAVTWDSGAGQKGVACYTNGVKLKLWDMLSGNVHGLKTGSAELTLGTYDVVTTRVFGKNRDVVLNPFRGSLTGLVLGRGAWSASQVRELWALGISGDLRGYLVKDADADGLPDWWERKFIGNLGSSGTDDNDDDGVGNAAEWQKGADPLYSDTDRDGLLDGVDSNAVSRVFVDPGDPAFTDGNQYDYPGPAWLKRIWKEGGEWSSWIVAATNPPGQGRMFIEVDRTRLNRDLRMEVEFEDPANASLYMDLLTTNRVPVATNLFGNLLTGTGKTVRKTWQVPLAMNSSAAIICLRRGFGEVVIHEMLLYVDLDEDGLDEEAERQFHTSDQQADSDGDGFSDGEEVAAGTDPQDAGSSPSIGWVVVSGSIAYAGRQQGAIHVLAATSNGLAMAEAVVAEAGPYVLEGVRAGQPCWIRAFRDSNTNGLMDATEARAEYGMAPVILQENARIDLVLEDPDTDTDSLPDWWEVKYFGDLRMGAQDDPDGDGWNNMKEFLRRVDPGKKWCLDREDRLRLRVGSLLRGKRRE